MLHYFLIISLLSGLATAQTRTFRNSNLDGDLKLCVNDGGNKNSCPIVITGSTSDVAITGTTLTNVSITNVSISSLTALSGNDIAIDAGTGETSLKVRDDGTTSTSNQGCNGITDNSLCTGSYTPTITPVSTCDVTPVTPTRYFRIGDLVHVFGTHTMKSGGFTCHNTSGRFLMSVPITNGGTFSSDNQVSGNFECMTSGASGGAVVHDNAASVVEFDFDSTISCNNGEKIHYEFTYEIP